MRKMYMSFNAPAPQSRAALAPRAPVSTSRAEGKNKAIRKMMNVYAPKTGGGCGSCGGAK